MDEIIHILAEQHNVEDEQLQRLIAGEENAALFQTADKVRRQVYSNQVYIRGLIEFTNYCRNE